MAVKVLCPRERLEKFVQILSSQKIFDSLSREPGTREIEDVNFLEHDPNTTEEELEENYRMLLSAYYSDQKTASELRRYGKTREKILANLGKHVAKCTSCLDRYREMLRQEVETNVKEGNVEVPKVETKFINGGVCFNKRELRLAEEKIYEAIGVIDSFYLGIIPD